MFLLVTVPGSETRRVSLEGDTVLIGRNEGADLRLDIDGVSRQHARITRGGGRMVSLVDLGAKNGTWLNGERIDVGALHNGDLIQIGPAKLEVVVRRAGDSAAPTPGAESSTTAPPHERLGLSAREWEVAVEIAGGASNPEIARKLGITRRTVATHLERIYQRLDIHSRAELAREVGRYEEPEE
jgi:DNA-binding CsgD family transcriptional regulator